MENEASARKITCQERRKGVFKPQTSGRISVLLKLSRSTDGSIHSCIGGKPGSLPSTSTGSAPDLLKTAQWFAVAAEKVIAVVFQTLECGNVDIKASYEQRLAASIYDGSSEMLQS